jgi:hypothetical protein
MQFFLPKATMRNRSQSSRSQSDRAQSHLSRSLRRAGQAVDNQRIRDRQRAVLPVRVSAVDNNGGAYSDLVHTLDITGTGVRLGAVHSNLRLGSLLTLQYKQHKADFRVVWISKRPCGREYQVGLQALVQRDLWGLEAEFKLRIQTQPESSAARA